MKRRAALLLAAALALSGCATAPKPAPELTPAQKAEAALARAVGLVESGTAESLGEAARALVSGEVDGATGAPVLLAVAETLYAKLYPELDSPFPAPPFTAADPSAASPFLGKVVPALVLLDPRAAIDEPGLASLEADLAVADGLKARSVLPPYLKAILLARRGGDAKGERDLLEESLRRAPSFYPAASVLADLVIRQGKAADELPRLEQLASLLPTPALRFAALARAELAGGQPQKAADAAAQGLLIAPDDDRFAILRAQAMENMGNWYQSLWILDALLKVKPDHAGAILMKAGLLHEEEQNSPEALRVLDDAENRFPQDSSFPEMEGRILLSLGRSDEGVAALRHAYAIDPQRPTTLSLLLSQAAGAQHWDEALSWIDKIPAAARTPEDLRNGWRAAEGLGDPAAAVAYARAFGAVGTQPEALALEARSLVSAGRLPDALAVVNRALSLPLTPGQKSTLLAIRASAGATDPLADLRLALMADPENGDAVSAMAEALAARGDYRKAAEYAKHAAALFPRDPALARRAADFAARAESGE